MKSILRLMILGLFAAVIRNRWQLWNRLAPSFRAPGLLLTYPIRGPITLWASRNIGRTPTAVPNPAISFEEVELDDCQIHVYTDTTAADLKPALIWIHGGGYVAGNAISDAAVAARYAEIIGGVVVNVDYRLAPEFPFPAALDDCYAALEWIHQQASARNIDTSRIAVGGMSAGGGLAATLAQRAYDNQVALRFQFLIYPMLDPLTAVLSDTDNRGLTWTRGSNEFAWEAYLGHSPGIPELRDYAAPANRKNLAGLPPAWIGVGDADLFYAENLQYVERLNAAGVKADLVVAPGMYHAADRIVPDHPEVATFIAASENALQQALRK